MRHMKQTALIIIGGLGLVALVAQPARAQLGTTGVIAGSVKDDANGAALAGVTVVATSPALQGTAAELTDEGGQYTITNLPSGKYEVTFYYSDITVRRTGIDVQVGKTVPVHVRVNTGQAGGEVITIEEKAPSIDVGSTKQGITVDQDYMRNIPLPGRTFEGALSGAAGSQGDALGISFSGSTSLENSYIIDGINTTGLSFGTVGSPILNNFIQEQEVITGGYDAEFGRSTGGVVNVVTKSGSNEFHGTVFSAFEPSQLHLDRTEVPTSSAAIREERVPNYYLDFGFDLGGPIIKDKLWFYVGFAPVISSNKRVRKLSTRVDREINDHNYGEMADGDGDPNTSAAAGCEATQTCESDDQADLDRKTGYVKFEEIAEGRQTFLQSSTEYNVIGKLNFAVNPDHQGALSFYGLPGGYTSYGLYGTPESSTYDIEELTTDTSLKWTSKFANNKTQVDAVLGWHRYAFDVAPHYSSAYGPDTGMSCEADGTNCANGEMRINMITLPSGDDTDLGIAGRNPYHRENQRVLDLCTDQGSGDPTVADPFPTIQNCPTDTAYRIGGAGGLINSVEQRLAAKLTVTERLKAAGHHEIKLGADVENNLLSDQSYFTGGMFNYYHFGYIFQDRYVRVAPDKMNADPGEYPDICGYEDLDGDGMEDDPVRCRYLSDLSASGNTFNWAAFLQDKWQILPNLTFKAGVRYEQQILRYAEQIQGTIDPVTGDELGTNAMNLKNLIAPRVGILYDWTKEGRSKVYANFGRFYESIPMDINTRSFGGETSMRAIYDPINECNPDTAITDGGVTIVPAHPSSCPGVPPIDNPPSILGESTIVTPGVKPQYMDEFVTGVEYELLEDLNVGGSYQNRRLGRVVEDVSVDGANTYVIANPGEFPESEENALRDEIQALMDAGDVERAQVLQGRLDQFVKIREFDKPRREYNAFQLTAKKRYSKNFFVQGSYTYSVLEGNFPGLFSPDNGQADPNISSQYDLIELLTNRNGRLPHDRPHVIKLDGYYNFDLREAGNVTTGVRLRAQSGTPEDALAAHYYYGPRESFVLPRGTFGRTDFITQADLHVAYGRDIAKDMTLEVYFDIFNVFNLETQFAIDESYSYQSANPIVGGSKDDLAYLKHVNEDDGKETGEQVRKNLNFGNPVSRFDSMRGRVGLQLRF
jgi:hypothetical protein